ncbi:MAG TPA: hypothetical protein VLQ45_29860 [Thermoanaerobaculia bacterium]|nr:hypothetical protein [Thermoanaerobaculia bacterium]
MTQPDDFTELSHVKTDRRAVRRRCYDSCLRQSVVVLGPLETEPVPSTGGPTGSSWGACRRSRSAT